jgi:nicotinamidase-related amidase
MKKILLVIDMQNGFARYDETKELQKKIRELLERKLFDAVVATRFLNDDNSTYQRLIGWNRLKTEEERELAEGYDKYVDHVVDKSVYTCINPSFIQKLCQLNDGKYPEEIFIVGADTDCCILITATGLFECNIRPVVLTRYCFSNGGPASHEAGLLCMRRLIGEKQLVDREILTREDLDV